MTAMSYRSKRNYENLQCRIFSGAGKYEIPYIFPEDYSGAEEFIGFNFVKSCKDPWSKGVHFFLDDYQFSRLWTNVDAYIPILRRFSWVMTPDFSTYTDFPKAIQIYNHYRKHWVGAYMQEAGIRVIPTISWSTPDSYEWCFDGEPAGGTVAVSSVGCMGDAERRRLFLQGYEAMIDRLHPKKIIFYGTIPQECAGNVIPIKAFQEKLKTLDKKEKTS